MSNNQRANGPSLDEVITCPQSPTGHHEHIPSQWCGQPSEWTEPQDATVSMYKMVAGQRIGREVKVRAADELAAKRLAVEIEPDYIAESVRWF